MKIYKGKTPYQQKKIDERNKLIWTLYTQGMPYRNIGRIVDLTYGRVYQLLNEMKIKNAEK